VLDRLRARGVPTLTVGGVDELFAGRGISDPQRTSGLADHLEALGDLGRSLKRGLVFANPLGDDRLDGRISTATARSRALEHLDAGLRTVVERLHTDDLLMVTADHGGDPAIEGHSHTREHVPLLVAGRRVRPGVDLGLRPSLADVGATLAEYFGAAPVEAGMSFLAELR
jgi:phosphopentomutase